MKDFRLHILMRLKFANILVHNMKIHINFINGNEYHYLGDNLHREDGPAVIFADGSKS